MTDKNNESNKWQKIIFAVITIVGFLLFLSGIVTDKINYWLITFGIIILLFCGGASIYIDRKDKKPQK